MFENPRRGRQARNFTTNVPKILVLKSSSEQIFSRKLPLGAPGLGFPFYLGPLSPVYLLVTAQGLAAYSFFTTQSFCYSLKDLLAQLSVSMRSLLVSVLENWVFSSLSFGTRF